VDHGLRPESAHDVEVARDAAARIGVAFVCHRVDIAPGPNLEARARAARAGALPVGTATGHTADDQAETVLLNLVRGAGLDGLTGMAPGPTHPILRLRRAETHALCVALRLPTADDASNRDARFRRNRIRLEALPLLDAIAERDVAALLSRTADVLRDDLDLLDTLAASIDPTDAKALVGAHPAIARRAIRTWLSVDGYPPDAAAVVRVLDVAAGRATACELPGGRRVERSRQRLRVVTTGR